MSSKCDHCGAESSLEDCFFKVPKSFSRKKRTLCPVCNQQQQHVFHKRLFLFNLGIGLLSFATTLGWPEIELGQVMFNLFLFQLFAALSILPHELGHAWMARLLGMKVFRILLGSGPILRTFRLFGFECELRSLPTGGLVIAGHPDIPGMRLKEFAFITAGLLANAFLIAAIWPLLDVPLLWSVQQLKESWQPTLVFFYANVVVLASNLWPRNIGTDLGALPSDGRRLFKISLLSRQDRELAHATYFRLEAAHCYEQGRLGAARDWVREGLTTYPDSYELSIWDEFTSLVAGDYQSARTRYIKLLEICKENAGPRALALNCIAYADVLIGNPELLTEADSYSHEAMKAHGWHPDIRGTRGAVLVALGDFDEGLPMLHESLAMATTVDDKAQNACLIAEAEFRRGNRDTARQYLKQAQDFSATCSLLSRVELLLGDASPPD